MPPLVPIMCVVGFIVGLLLSDSVQRWFASATDGLVRIDVLDASQMLRWRFALGSAAFFASVPLAVLIAGPLAHPPLRFAAFLVVGVVVSALTTAFFHHILADWAEAQRTTSFGPFLAVSQMPSAVIPLAGAGCVLIIAGVQRWLFHRSSHATPLPNSPSA